MRKLALNSIVLKLGGTIMVLFLVVLIPFVYVIDQIFSGVHYDQVHEYIDDLSTDFQSSIKDVDNKEQLKLYENLGHYTKTEILVVNNQGEILTDSNLQRLRKGTNLDKKLFNSLKENKRLYQNYVDSPTKNYYLLSGRPLIRNNDFIGGVLVFSSIDDIYNSTHEVRKYLILTIIGSLFLALGFTYFVAKKLSSPLIEMEKITRRIAKSDLNISIKKISNDEIGSLAQAINDLAVELRDYRTNRSEFLANISHELRTPISYLSGYASVLRKHLYETEKEKEEYLAIIENESARLSVLINDLFELSKMEENKIDLYKEWIDSTEIIESVLGRVKLKAKDKNLALQYEAQAALPLILSDGMRLEQVFINLIENAIRYTNEGYIKIRAWSEKGRVLIAIKDTGPGIPEEDLPFIFDRFYRVEKSRSRKMGGTGLGLAIVRELVKVLGGYIEVKSEVGTGTEFILSFPIDMSEKYDE